MIQRVVMFVAWQATPLRLEGAREARDNLRSLVMTSAESMRDTLRRQDLLLLQYDDEANQARRDTPRVNTKDAATRILGRRTAPFPPFLIPDRVPHGFTPRC